MHERSLARTLIDQIDEECRARHIRELVGVRLEVGEFAGIEPVLLESAFAELAAEQWPQTVQLSVTRVPLRARCALCQTEFLVERFQFLCPTCNHAHVMVIAGEELRLVSLLTNESRAVESVIP
jgi:hydrogenase nickel incorporation protein HypA/HybF